MNDLTRPLIQAALMIFGAALAVRLAFELLLPILVPLVLVAGGIGLLMLVLRRR